MSNRLPRLALAVFILLGFASGEPSSQIVLLKQVMRQKLVHSEALLEAVVTTNWSQLALHSRALGQLTNNAAWSALKTPEYVRQSEGFVRATQDLVEAAENRDSEGAPLAFVAVTLSCVRCHQYVSRARIAHVDRQEGSGQSEAGRLAIVRRPE